MKLHFEMKLMGLRGAGLGFLESVSCSFQMISERVIFELCFDFQLRNHRNLDHV